MLKDKIILLYYILINIISFALYGIDKKKAQKQLWRIPEKSLFLTAFLGGALGALSGMEFFHHKTKKIYFYILNIFALFLHVIIMYLIFFYT